MRTELLFKVKAYEAMEEDYITVSQEILAEDLHELMVINKKEEAVVVSKNRQVIGIITKSQLKNNLDQQIEPNIPIKHLMTNEVYCVKRDVDLLQVREELKARGIKRAPVINEQKQIMGLIKCQGACDELFKHIKMIMVRLQNILDNISDAVCVINREGRIVYWNDMFEKLFALKEIEVLHKFIGELVPEYIYTRLSKPEEIDYEQIFAQNNKYFILGVSLCPTGAGKTLTFRDITNILHLSEELDKNKSQVMLLEEELKKVPETQFQFGEIIGNSSKMIKIINILKRVAPSTSTILIEGESGTGKELLAKATHENSPRKDKPFIAVNCGAIPVSLFESEIFGYEPGAFTGAGASGKNGIFKLADGGTIFLDEIGELPLGIQVKLLRVLQEQTFYRVGGTKPVAVNVRVIAATNRNLEELIRKGTFREDLFYRINVIRLKVPPLRQRREEIVPLANYFIKDFSVKNNIPIKQIDNDLYEHLMECSWPGNVRELKNITERLVLLAENGVISKDLLPEMFYEDKIIKNNKATVNQNVNQDVNLEYQTLIKALEENFYNKTKTAHALNISRSTLYNKMKKYNINIK